MNIGGVNQASFVPLAATSQPNKLGNAISEQLKSVTNKTSSLSIKDVPNVIHHFWQGDTKGLLRHAGNLNKIASINPSYEVKLHVLPEANSSESLRDIKNLLIGVKVIDINSEKWFSEFKKSTRYEQFTASREGARPHFASGADIIKTELLQHKGGVWNDVDNKPLQPLPDKLQVTKGGMLTAGVTSFSRWGGEDGIHSSTLATHPKNAMLSDINKESFKKYEALKGVIYNVNERTSVPDEHFKMISETAGSLHLSRELMARDKDFEREVNDLKASGKKFNESKVIFDKYFEPTASTGLDMDHLDDDQLVNLLQGMGPPGHVVI